MFNVHLKTTERLHFTPCSSVSIVNFEQVIVSWYIDFPGKNKNSITAQELQFSAYPNFWRYHMHKDNISVHVKFLGTDIFLCNMFQNPFANSTKRHQGMKNGKIS